MNNTPISNIGVHNLIDKQKRTVLLRAFRIWQCKPHELAPLSEATHQCASCGTMFTGNYCPRCGQSAKVGRFSFKKAIMLFLDVWGMGNRSFFRSIRDLMLRPGYMIRDYLSGMQSAYFPPFKMFFILTAFSLVVEQGFNLGLIEEEEGQATKPTPEVVEQADKADKTNVAEEVSQFNHVKITGDNNEVPLGVKKGLDIAKIMNALRKKYPAVFALLTLVLFSAPLFFFLRSAPNIPDLRYSEFLVALIYTSNMFSIYSIIGNLLDSGLIRVIALLMIFIALKQFSGYSKLRVLRYLILTILISIVLFALLMAIGTGIVYLVSR